MSTPKPKRADVEAVAREMEREGDWLAFMYEKGWDHEYQRDVTLAALRLLLRRRDRVIRDMVTEAECGWMERGQDAVERINDAPVTPSELRLNEILNIKAEYDRERRGRGKGK
jgi:hypothetical protein